MNQENYNEESSLMGSNKLSALSGNDNMGELRGDQPEVDLKLKKAIKKELNSFKDIDSSEIEISVKDGFVSLTGSMNSREELKIIEKKIEAVEGVNDLVSLVNISGSEGEDRMGVPSPS